MAADRVVVSLATKSRSGALLDLERSLDHVGFRGARLIWRPGEWPDGAPAHEDVPFAFKAFCLEEARKRGYGAALWLDANAVAVGSLDPLFEQIYEHGYVLFANRNYRLGEWASDEALAAVGLAREAALLLREVNAAALGLRFSHPAASQFLDGWLAEARKATVFRGTAGKYDAKRDFRALKWNVEGSASPDPRVRGHRFDQTAAGIVAHRQGMRLTTSGLESASRLRSVRPETAIVKWHRREPILGLRFDLMLVRMHRAMSRRPLRKHREWFNLANLPGNRRSPRRDQPSRPVVKNANRVPRRRRRRKRALLVYLPNGAFTLGPGDQRLFSHTNKLRCRRMAEVLGELGYMVDAVHKRDLRFAPSRGYELVIGEHRNSKGLEASLSPSAIQVFLATTLSHATHNRNVRRRHDLLLERGRAPIQVRRVYGENLPVLRTADALVGVGNEFTMGTWAEAYDGPIHRFHNYAFPGMDGLVERRDFTRARRSFLYFASGSQMQKGLDLLLEIFPRHPDLELYVCSGFDREEDFCSSYGRELFETENVHPVGWVQVNSPQFAQLVSCCGSVIHPSCSEGQAGAVVQCLATGLVPLVTRESGVDTDDYGITFADDSVETIERVILEVAERPADWHEERSRCARHAAQTTFTLDHFTDRWRSLISEIVGAGPRRP